MAPAGISSQAPATGVGGTGHNSLFLGKGKPAEIRSSNMEAAKAVADCIRTSLGPRGMDKMIQDGKGQVTITNDGATILKQMNVAHPAAKMLVELSKAQDTEAGDGTTTVVVLAGSLMQEAEKLLRKGVHPTQIAEGFRSAGEECQEIIRKELATPLDISDVQMIWRCAATSLNSKVVSQQASQLAPIAQKAVFSVIDPASDCNVDLRDIKVHTVLGGTVEDTELVDGLLLDQRICAGPKRVEKAKVGLIQFCISPPKTDMDLNVIISDYTQMDRVLKEERNYILDIIKKIKAAGCNVLLIQKSILRDSLNDLALHFLDKLKILTIRDIEREDVEFVSKSLGCRPIASLDHFTAKSLASVELVEEFNASGTRLVRFNGIENPGKTVSIMVRGSNKLVLHEAERSLHDALCVVRCLVKERGVVAGGGAPEIELSVRLYQRAMELTGVNSYCYKGFSEALEVIPMTLAENAGLPAISTITELRKLHASGNKNAGLNINNIRTGSTANAMEDYVVQPSLVTISAINLATEFLAALLKIDDIVNTVR